ncbi:MAG: hypothetical protein J1F32_05560 [Erysipelotrichales bacterium]|nr:hypothetical protein [Erysipelotrichales bacterium]
MQNKLLKKFTVLFALGTILTSCGDFKTPLAGYITKDEVNAIVNNFKKGASEFSKYSYKGNFNYFAYSEDLMPGSISKSNIEFLDAPDYYVEDNADKPNEPKANSYYLRLPLRITPTSWSSDKVSKGGLPLSTQYQLEAKIYRPEGLDSIYYYKRDEGGFILRTFGVNKALIIQYPSGITSRGKWNIEVEYDADGYLCREYFATVNASEDNKSECCYGEATYTFSK